MAKLSGILARRERNWPPQESWLIGAYLFFLCSTLRVISPSFVEVPGCTGKCDSTVANELWDGAQQSSLIERSVKGKMANTSRRVIYVVRETVRIRRIANLKVQFHISSLRRSFKTELLSIWIFAAFNITIPSLRFRASVFETFQLHQFHDDPFRWSRFSSRQVSPYNTHYHNVGRACTAFLLLGPPPCNDDS